MIAITCTCGKSLKLKPEYAGKKVRCPGCQTVIKAPELPIPESSEETPSGASVSDKASAALQGIGSSLAGLWNKKKPDAASDSAPRSTVLIPTKRSVFEHLTAQKQDPAIIEKVAERVSAILSANEELLYIAIQQRPLVNWFPDCVVLTSRRVILYHPKILGRVDMSDYIWRKVQNARLQENMIGSTLSFDTTEAKRFHSTTFPKSKLANSTAMLRNRKSQRQKNADCVVWKKTAPKQLASISCSRLAPADTPLMPPLPAIRFKNSSNSSNSSKQDCSPKQSMTRSDLRL